MEYLLDPILIKYIALSFTLGTGLGAFFLFPSHWFGNKKTSSSKISSEKSKLENEVLRDQVKQLEAKIATLEKALEMSS